MTASDRMRSLLKEKMAPHESDLSEKTANTKSAERYEKDSTERDASLTLQEREACSPENRVAEELAFLLQYLELNNEMERYLILYRLLSENVLDGMRISKELRNICLANGISFMPERMEMIADYGDYVYMQRKWKKEIRRQRKLSKTQYVTNKISDIEKCDMDKEGFPEWKTVVSQITNFGKPLWESLCMGELFVGDWMPELGKFLD